MNALERGGKGLQLLKLFENGLKVSRDNLTLITCTVHKYLFCLFFFIQFIGLLSKKKQIIDRTAIHGES